MATHSAPSVDCPVDAETTLPVPPAVIRELRQALLAIRYGAIDLVIHDGRVVQLEWREKVRFERDK
jgi:hypothetical protein